MPPKLRDVREREGLSRPQLAKLAGISEKTLQRAEAGVAVMNTTRSKIVNALNRREDRLRDYAVDDVCGPSTSHPQEPS